MWRGFHVCSNIALDPLGHHAATGRQGGDVVVCHNPLRGAFVEICHQVHLGVHVEGGTHLICHTPDQLGIGWAQGKLAAFDIAIRHVYYISILPTLAGTLLSVIPSPGLNIQLDSLEFQTAMHWWLGMSVSQRASCCCYHSSFFGLHHHDWYCKDVVTCHNRLHGVMTKSLL